MSSKSLFKAKNVQCQGRYGTFLGLHREPLCQTRRKGLLTPPLRISRVFFSFFPPAVLHPGLCALGVPAKTVDSRPISWVFSPYGAVVRSPDSGTYPWYSPPGLRDRCTLRGRGALRLAVFRGSGATRLWPALAQDPLARGCPRPRPLPAAELPEVDIPARSNSRGRDKPVAGDPGLGGTPPRGTHH
jgi:hypothetical protein